MGSANALGSASPISASAPPALLPEGAASAAPPLFDANGKLLPQTEERPKVDSPVFKRRIALLFEAIVRGDAELARELFFPKPAYEVVKTIEKPGKDWEARLYRAFVRDVREYHEKLGKEPEKAQLVGLDLDEERVKWMKPHKEGNALGYFRVTKSKLKLRDAREKALTLELTSFISWRGEWHLVHLHGFK